MSDKLIDIICDDDNFLHSFPVSSNITDKVIILDEHPH